MAPLQTTSKPLPISSEIGGRRSGGKEYFSRCFANANNPLAGCSEISGDRDAPKIGRPRSEDVATRRALSKSEKKRRFFQTSYAAASWSKPRKIVARVELISGVQGSDIRFIVTNLPGRAKVLYEKVYSPPLIKDMKLTACFYRSSCHRWEASQFRLFLT